MTLFHGSEHAIQVEHPCRRSPASTWSGADQVGFGAPLSLKQEDVRFKGHAIECRITADDARDDFMPSPGDITCFALPEGDRVRIDTHCHPGCTISPYYDSLLAKLITTGDTRAEALANMKAALTDFRIGESRRISPSCSSWWTSPSSSPGISTSSGSKIPSCPGLSNP